jgi:hypothetical protein
MLGPSAEVSDRRILLAITAVALALRVGAALFTIDIPGDGPARAVGEYRWGQSPTFLDHGVWLPGYRYVFGSFSMLLPNPRITPRVLNILLGTASIPLLYGVARRLFGAAVALTAAAVLALFPLHVGLSASSLTEAGFLCGLLALLYIALSVEPRFTRGTALRLTATIFLGVLLETIRYEAWFLLPPVAAYLTYRLRSVRLGICLALAWSAFPLWWSAQNYWHRGDALLGYTVAASDGAPAAPLTAVRLQWRVVRNCVGALAALIMLGGCVNAAVRVVRRNATLEQTLYVALVAIAWAILFGMTLRRGQSVWGRYYLLAVALTFPLAAAWLHHLVSSRRIHVAIAAGCFAFYAANYFTYRPTVFVTRHPIPDIHAFLSWRASSTYSGDAVLVTRMDWQATYFPYYALDLAGRAHIVTPDLPEAHMRDFFRWNHPTLLITRADDSALVRRVEQVAGRSIGPEHLVKTVGRLEVFDIRHLDRDWSTDSDPPR